MPYFVSNSELAERKKNALVAATLSLFFGTLGVHRFYLGRKSSGTITLLSTLLSFGLLALLWIPLTIVEALVLASKHRSTSSHPKQISDVKALDNRSAATRLKPAAQSTDTDSHKTPQKSTNHRSMPIEGVSRPQNQVQAQANKQDTGVAIYDVSSVDTPPIMQTAESKTANAKQKAIWTSRLQVPYERQNLRITELRDAVYGVYEQLAEYIDKKLRKQGSSLNYLLEHPPRDEYSYYDNLLYTIFCIAEGHVTEHYIGERGYDNAFSYSLLIRRTDTGFAEDVRQYADSIVRQLPPASDEIKRAFGLTPNGLPVQWWDPDGQLRERYKIGNQMERILRITPSRSTKIFELPEVRMHIFRQYAQALAVLAKQRRVTDGWRKRIGSYVDDVFDGSRYYVDNHYRFMLLKHILKLCEQTIREALPYAKPLDVNEERAAIRMAIPKNAAGAVIAAATTAKEPINISDETLHLIAMQNPSAWKADVKNIGSKSLKEITSLLLKYTDPAIVHKIAREVVKHHPDKQAKIAALYRAQTVSEKDTDDWTVKQLANFIHPEQMTSYEKIVASNKPITPELLRLLGVLTKAPHRKVVLDREKIARATQEHNRAVESVTSYLGYEENEPDPNRNNPKTVQEPTISLDSLYTSGTPATTVDLSDDQRTFVRLVLDADEGLELAKATAHARANNKMLSGYIQAINKALYAAVGDQVFSEEDGKIVIDHEYVNTVRSMT